MVPEVDVLLSDGTAVHLRPIRPQDAPSLVAMHSRFSERTRYLRYFSAHPRIPERELRRFVNVDHHDREALVIELGDRLIAVGQYERLGEESEQAEVAFEVEDAYQGKGAGSILLEHLAAAARDAGLTRFVAEVLPVNAAMLRVFADAGYEVQRQYADGMVHLTFPIAPTEQSLAVQWHREQVTEARSIARLLAPRAIAVYGVRRDGRGIGARLLRHLASFAGPVYPIHPSAFTLPDPSRPDDSPAPSRVPAYPSLSRVPGPVDLAVVAVPADSIMSSVRDAAAAGVAGLVVFSAGFAEAGPAGAARQDELLRACRAAGMRLIGPYSLGIANNDPAVRLNATLAETLPAPGRLGLFTQSGALGVALLAEAGRRGLGVASFVCVGNRADVSGNDLLQYWQSDPATDVVLLYLETVGNPRKFARLARRLGRDKPVVTVASPFRPPALAALRAGGRTAGGAAQRRAGTALRADQDAAGEGGAVPAQGADPHGVTTLFDQSGVIRVDTVPEMFDVAVLLANQPLPAGSRVGIVTNSSALGALTAGSCVPAGLRVGRGYPVDVGSQAAPDEFSAALACALGDGEVDALLVACAPPLPDAPGARLDGGFAAAVATAARNGVKPVVATLLAAAPPAGVPGYPSVEEAVRALGRVARYAQWRRTPEGEVPELSHVDVEAARTAGTAEELLAAYGVPVLPSRLVAGADAAVAAAAELGYPVVLKVADPALRHRVDLGAVRLDLADADAVRRACAELDRLFAIRTALIVQSQVAPGTSWVVEVVEDPSFGPIVGFGPGGVLGDLVGDRAWRAAPLTVQDAASLVRQPKAAPLLFGHRGAPPGAVDAVVDLLLRVGRLADEQTRVRQLRLNPVLVRPDGVSVLHATVHYGQELPRLDSGPRRLASWFGGGDQLA